MAKVTSSLLRNICKSLKAQVPGKASVIDLAQLVMGEVPEATDDEKNKAMAAIKALVAARSRKRKANTDADGGEASDPDGQDEEDEMDDDDDPDASAKQVPPVLSEIAEQEVKFMLGKMAAGAALTEEETTEGLEALQKLHEADQKKRKPTVPDAEEKNPKKGKIHPTGVFIAPPDEQHLADVVLPNSPDSFAALLFTDDEEVGQLHHPEAPPVPCPEAVPESGDPPLPPPPTPPGSPAGSGVLGEGPHVEAALPPGFAAVGPAMVVPPRSGIVFCRTEPLLRSPFWFAKLPDGKKLRGSNTCSRSHGRARSEAQAQRECWNWLCEAVAEGVIPPFM
eukprot:9475614-Pyramimonas_sp.AAC.1